jgi:hypothetical protein
MLKYTYCLITLGMGIVCASCAGSLDLLGEEAAVTESVRNKSEIEDDKLEDKDVSYDPARIIEETFGEHCTIRLNKSATITKLDIVLPEEDDPFKERVFSDRGTAIEAIDREIGVQRSEYGVSLIPSIEVVNGAMKPFNDGLYAAIEIGVQEGLQIDDTELFPSKRLFLKELLAALLALRDTAEQAFQGAIEDAAIDIGASLIVAGEQPELPAAVLERAHNAATDFANHPLFSRPIGFYAWSPLLEEIFMQDRYLQNYQVEYDDDADPLSPKEVGKAAALALVIDADQSLKERYQKYLALYRGLTNPFMNFPVTDLLPYLSGIESLGDLDTVNASFIEDSPSSSEMGNCDPHFALFPSSTSKETAYFELQYCDGAPSDLNYLDELIRAIREHLIDLEPTENSGWYDYQSYALETMLLPERGEESDHLLLTKAYKKKLIETFKTIIIQNRETHAKQLGMSSEEGSAAIEVDLYPLFPVEPFATFFLRSARAYRFLRAYLASVLTVDFLEQSRRLVEDGSSSEMSLDQELKQKTELLYGLYFLSADSVGLQPELMPQELQEYDEQTCRATAVEWLREWRKDGDVLRDMRVILPVHRDVDEQEAVYWATLGITAVKARAEFVEGFEPRDISGCWTGEIVPHDYYLMAEVSAEVRLPLDAKPPTRDELRRICDQYDTVDEMVEAIEKQ